MPSITFPLLKKKYHVFHILVTKLIERFGSFECGYTANFDLLSKKRALMKTDEETSKMEKEKREGDEEASLYSWLMPNN